MLLAKPVPSQFCCWANVSDILFRRLSGQSFSGTCLALGIRTGFWPATYLLCLPLVLLQFVILYQFSVLVAVVTRSTVAAIFRSLVLCFICYPVNLGRPTVHVLPELNTNLTPFSPTARRLADVAYWIRPKPADLVVLRDNVLQAGEHCDALPLVLRHAQQNGLVAPEWSVVTSLASASPFRGSAGVYAC